MDGSAEIQPTEVKTQLVNGREMTSAMQEITGNNKVKKLSAWHVMIVDWRLENPALKWKVCAEYFMVQQAWLSSIINSDLFKIYYAQRLETHQELVSKTIIAAASETALTGMNVLRRKMLKEEESSSLIDVASTTDIVMKALGYGHKVGPANAQVIVNVGAIDQEALADARETMKAVNHKNTQDVEDAQELSVLDEEVNPYEAPSLVQPPPAARDESGQTFPMGNLPVPETESLAAIISKPEMKPESEGESRESKVDLELLRRAVHKAS